LAESFFTEKRDGANASIFAWSKKGAAASIFEKGKRKKKKERELSPSIPSGKEKVLIARVSRKRGVK